MYVKSDPNFHLVPDLHNVHIWIFFLVNLVVMVVGLTSGGGVPVEVVFIKGKESEEWSKQV